MPAPAASRRRWAWLALAVAAAWAAGALAGCGAKGAAPEMPELPPPPSVSATVPPARSVNVVYDTEIHVDFAQDLSVATLTTSNVFLKLDTQRVPIGLVWDAALRRLRILPLDPLKLRRTYTVELSPAVLTAEGASFGPDGWFFQFTTNSVRRPTTPRPRPGTSGESPFVMLSWDSTEASAGAIRYEVWSGGDSADVLHRAGLPTATVTKPKWLPTAPWPLGAPLYWGITVINDATGERLEGPVQRFDTLPAGAPEDSVTILSTDSGFNTIQSFSSPIYPYQYCSGESLQCRIAYQCWVWFDLSTLPADVRIASVRLEMATYDHYAARLAASQLFLWSSLQEWVHPCRPNLNYPEQLPARGVLLANHEALGGRRFRFAAPLLASHLEAAVRRGGYYGFELTTTQTLALAGSRIADPAFRPALKIHFFRTPPAPAAAIAP